MTAQIVYKDSTDSVPLAALEFAAVTPWNRAEKRLEVKLTRNIDGVGTLWERVKTSGVEQGHWSQEDEDRDSDPDWVRHEDPDLWRKNRIEDEA